jgi:hypothetical protein
MCSGGLETLQALDAASFKLLFDDNEDFNFITEVLPPKGAEFARNTCDALNPFLANAPLRYQHPYKERTMALESCATSLLQFKFEMLLTPKQYAIDWMSPGRVFDDNVMQAMGSGPEDYGSTVKLCVSPAIVQYDSRPITEVAPDDYASVSICNKVFFPGQGTVRSKEVVMAKAVVVTEQRKRGGGSGTRQP